MPRQPASPVSFDACSYLAPCQEDDSIVGSDDNLDEPGRAAQRQRIEKLAEAYLQGTPLFILSSSLRGPLDKGWENPWKKERRKTSDIQQYDKRSQKEIAKPEQLVIPETNPRKRPQNQSVEETPHSRARTGPLTPSLASSIGGETSLSRRVGSHRKQHHSPHLKSTDADWLRKDRGSPRFQTADPPTSPTTSVTPRHKKSKSRMSKSNRAHYEQEIASAGSLKSHRSTLPTRTDSSPRNSHDGNNAASMDIPRSFKSGKRDAKTHPVNADSSFYIVSSSSQLPKFEYRRKKYGDPDIKVNYRPPIDQKVDEPTVSEALLPSGILLSERAAARAKSHSQNSGMSSRHEENILENPQDSLTLTNASDTADNLPTLNPEKESTNTTKGSMIMNLPSAQHGPENPPTLDYVTSLHSIAISKGNSNDAEEGNPEAQFSTQAALLLAQRSFQNDLKSPEQSPAFPAKKRRASQTLNTHSPGSVNITPFHRLGTPQRTRVGHLSNESRTTGGQMISTQYIIEAVTPFTFSTEKKADTRKDNSTTTKKRKATSFALSSPSEIQSKMSNSGEKSDQEPVSRYSPNLQCPSEDTQQSALPMTLTGTTPPTAQDGQGAPESFNLSQAIADAGSWLQQSFEINNDIKQCRSFKPPPTFSVDAG